MIYKQIIPQRVIPFELKLPTTQSVSVTALTEEQLDVELEKGYTDMLKEHTKPADKVFSDIRKDYEI